ncbi:MAG: hypothetical protein QOJ78_402 [Pseudonocardiales bacterium]|nr:hypothetical protein [Pseudonocardiales bacterium]
MTFQPPPPPPPPPPGGNPPPPPGGYPPPGGGYPAPHSGFDPKNVNPLDWAIVGAGVLAFLFSFIAFYDGADISSGGQSATVSTGTFSAWHDVIGGGFFSWFAMVFAILGAAAVALQLFAPHVKLPVSNRLAGLALFAAAALFEIIGIFVTPGGSGSLGLGGSYDVSLNHGFGFWISLIVILAGLVLSLMRFQASGERLPGALAGIPNIGGYGPHGGIGGPSGPQPGPGAAPPPPPGYGPPR